LNRTTTATGFLFLIFDLEYLKEFKVEPLHAKMNPTSCLFGYSLHVLKPQSFPPNRAPKMRERHQLLFGLQLEIKEFQHPAIQTKIEQRFGGFFHQIKVHQPIGRQDSIQTESEQAGGWIHFCMKRLKTLKSFFKKNFKSEIKNSKTYSG
jgi:hypothetical protein